MLRDYILLGALALLGVNASPQILGRAPQCNRDNLLRCFVDARYSTQASAYCGALEPSTTTVATVTATSTSTVVDTVTADTITNTITSTETVYTLTIPSQTATVTRLPPIKREAAPPAALAPPKCMTNGVTYSPARITSACSCIEVPAQTISVTYTAATETVTARETEYATATTSTTVYETVRTHTVSGVQTVTVDPPAPSNRILNGGFESGYDGWITSLTTSSTPTFFQHSSPGQNSDYCFRGNTYGSGIILLQRVTVEAGKTFQVGFSAKNMNGGVITSIGTHWPVFTATQVAGGWTEYRSSYTAQVSGVVDFRVRLQWVDDHYFDNFFLFG